MIFYVVEVDYALDGMEAHPTLRQARERQYVGTTIRKITTPRRITRDVLCALYTHKGFAATQEDCDD